MKSNRVFLCFTKNGLSNDSAIDKIVNKSDVSSIVIFSDGSEEALEHIKKFQSTRIFYLPRIEEIGIAKVPLYSISVVSSSGKISKPNFFHSEDLLVKFICHHVAGTLDIYMSDVTSPTNTQVKLDKKQSEAICFLAYDIWRILHIAEEKLAFPAVIIDKITPWTYYLTPQTMDIDVIRNNVGINTLFYDEVTEFIRLEFMGETYTVKLKVLNDLYGEIILPKMNRLRGRRLRWNVSIKTEAGESTDPSPMSYGDIGRLIEEARTIFVEKEINSSSPIAENDLYNLAVKLTTSSEAGRNVEDGFIWVGPDESIASVIDKNKDRLTRRPVGDNQPDD